jgi:hypothetical protein
LDTKRALPSTSFFIACSAVIPDFPSVAMPAIIKQDSIKAIANNMQIFISISTKLSFRKSQLKTFHIKIFGCFAINSGNIPANANVA